MAEPPVIALKEGRLAFGGKTLFDGLELIVHKGDRACLVGRNGSGKTTLMKVLTGVIELDAGELYIEPGLRIAHLEQDPAFDPEGTIFDFVAAGGHQDHEVEAWLSQMSLPGERQMGGLSGGELRRAAIARAFAGNPDVMLMDEPTNHLDLSAIQWLEREIAGFQGAILTISHDRTFLANITSGRAGRTLWLDRGRMRASSEGFDRFEAWQEEVLETEQKELDRLNSKIADETRWLLRGVTARRRRNQGRIRKLNQMRASRAAMLSGRPQDMKLEAEEGSLKSRIVIDAKDVSKSFQKDDGEELVLVEDFTTRILRHDRIGIIGPNGAGKTTLLRILTGESEPDRGRVKVAPALRVAYFDQRREQLDLRETPWRVLAPQGGDSIMVQGRQRHVVAHLKDFMFDSDQAKAPVGSLSGGERNRLLLAKILAEASDLLVLDEPTNDLDMDTLDLLQEMLADYSGTLILVSHDRDFLDRTVSSTIALEGKGVVREYPGGYKDYLAQRKTTPKKALGGEPAGDGPPPAKLSDPLPLPPKAGARNQTKLSYKDQRELDRLPKTIADLENEIAKIETALADPGLYQRDGAKFDRLTARHGEAQDELAAAEERWLVLEARREDLTKASA